MSYFPILLRNKNLSKHDGKSLWKYSLSDIEFNELVKEIQFSDNWNLDPRDSALYYAEWWKRNYNGGKPSKELVFTSIGGNIQYNSNSSEFFKSAKKGAEILGTKWIKRQNILYFRTLLMQGGLPLKHISENHSHYKNFLMAVLEEQPDSIEDFIFQPGIINHLPVTSRNDIIYENCFEIVRSILNEEKVYDDLFNSNDAIRTISEELKVRKKSLKKRERLIKPQNYWLLNLNKDYPKISLRLGLADNYSPESLSNILGFDACEKEYQFYLNDVLICVFRKMLSGNYKTNWSNYKKFEWDELDPLMDCYVITKDEKREVLDFIQLLPSLEKPSLWTRFSDKEWRLIKGNNINSDEAAILYPQDWSSDKDSENIILFDKTLNWMIFEGSAQLIKGEEQRNFLTNVSSFDWTILSQKPKWMLSSNLTVVQSRPKVVIYNEKNEIETNKQAFKISVKLRSSTQSWQLLSSVNTLSKGCYNMKIEREGVIAYDSFYNVGNLNVSYSNQTIDTANITISNNDFVFKIDESPILSVGQLNSIYNLKVDLSFNKIPSSINASIKSGTSKSLFFKLNSPFIGMALVNSEGVLISEQTPINFNNLHGIRILSPDNNTIIKMENELRTGVIISKEINTSSLPLISLKDELLRLFYLADAMNHENNVIIELHNSKGRKKYSLKGFTHSLNVENQLENELSLHDSEDELELFAVPLNCKVDDIDLIPLHREENKYKIPSISFTKQFIILSSYENNSQLMPRFVNTDTDFKGIDKNERIENYHKILVDEDYGSEAWKELLTYFKICIEQKLPFSTFDQLRAISKSSELASKAFFYLGVNQLDINEYIQVMIPDLEKDLGFCFHWANKEDWEISINEAANFIGNDYFTNVIELLSKYLKQYNLTELRKYLFQQEVNNDSLTNAEINIVRSNLGERVLKELPDFKPNVVEKYNIPTYNPVEILIKCAIAAAESITGVQEEFPIWGGDDHREKIRRNIQYTQYLTPSFYNKIIFNVLSKS